jgi:hypothetical protein
VKHNFMHTRISVKRGREKTRLSVLCRSFSCYFHSERKIIIKSVENYLCLKVTSLGKVEVIS